MERNIITSKSFGIVIYMEDDVYSDSPSQNENIHFPSSKEEIYLALLQELYDKKVNNYPLENFVIGHEHGSENKKCHMQIFISFEKRTRKSIEPGFFNIETNRYLYMAQKCKTPKKLRNYCKKGNDFFEVFPCKTIKEILKENGKMDILMDIDDPYDVLLNKNNLEEKQIINIFKNCPVTEFKKNFVNNSKQIFETYNKHLKVEEIALQFEWRFPLHMYQHIENNFGAIDKISLTYAKLYTWFKTYCEPEGYFRRKALFLFSIAGGLGKSYFARTLVPEISICNSPFYVYCRGTLDASEFSKKEKTAKLVILDDVNYISNDIEIWKALTVSEPTNIRTPYHNFPWQHSLPCIMLSNNIKTLRYWLETPDLKSRCLFISIDFYIGPPGTDSEEHHKVDSLLSKDVEKLLQETKQNGKCYNF